MLAASIIGDGSIPRLMSNDAARCCMETQRWQVNDLSHMNLFSARRRLDDQDG
jgi:hypothetical protein